MTAVSIALPYAYRFGDLEPMLASLKATQEVVSAVLRPMANALHSSRIALSPFAAVAQFLRDLTPSDDLITALHEEPTSHAESEAPDRSRAAVKPAPGFKSLGPDLDAILADCRRRVVR